MLLINGIIVSYLDYIITHLQTSIAAPESSKRAKKWSKARWKINRNKSGIDENHIIPQFNITTIYFYVTHISKV